MTAEQSKQRVIIIGAGMSGLAAARAFQDDGRFSVIILEGRDRIGGRTYTDTSLHGLSIDLGASWIHGPDKNPLTELASHYAIKDPSFTDFLNVRGGNFLAFSNEGEKLDTELFTQGYQAVEEGYEMMSRHQPHQRLDNLSFAQINELVFLPGAAEYLTDTADPSAKAGFYFHSHIRAYIEEAEDLDQVDWLRSAPYTMLPGGDCLLDQGGYSAIVHGLAEGLDIRTGVTVTAISYSNERDVSVIGSKATPTQERKQVSWLADRVIVTVPLGVLKEGVIDFQPPLPEAKQKAIERMGMGNYEKIILEFPEQFWPIGPHFICFVNEEPPHLFASWFNIAHYMNKPIIACHHAGSGARLIDSWDDERLVDGCMQTLRKMFGETIPNPIRYIRTKWGKDSFTRGGFSFAKVGQQPQDKANLATPLNEKVYFAGEATHSRFWGTVHGAYESGVRVYNEIVNDAAVIATDD